MTEIAEIPSVERQEDRTCGGDPIRIAGFGRVDDPREYGLRFVGAGDTAFRQSYFEAMREGLSPGSTPAPDKATIAAAEADPSTFFAELTRQTGLTISPTGEIERVPGSLLWLVEGDVFVGSINIRSRLATPFLANYGGNIGYGVRPSMRGRGLAKTMLSMALDVCAGMKLERVMITALEGNGASRAVILANGGRLIDVTPYPYGKDGDRLARYAVETGRVGR